MITIPLLAKGYTQPAIVGAVVTDQSVVNGNFENDRGCVGMVDLIPNIDPRGAAGMRWTAKVGPQNIVENVGVQQMAYTKNGIKMIVGGYQPNQTFNSTVTFDVAGGTFRGTFVAFYENPYMNELEIFKKPYLGLKQKDYWLSCAGAGTFTTGTVVLPKNQGTIYAVEFLTDFATEADQFTGIFGAVVNGVSIFENIPGTMGSFQYNRPNKIYPILIKPASTFAFTYVQTAVSTNRVGLRFYFKP